MENEKALQQEFMYLLWRRLSEKVTVDTPRGRICAA